MAFPKLTAAKHRWVIIGLCSAAMMLAFMDRAILPLFVEQIKSDLHVSDFDFSLLTGLAFTMMYSLCGIPIGMLIDRGPRPKLIAAGMLIWSLATSLTGFGKSFAHVFAARVAVGFGESTVSPGSQSMAADMFMGKMLGKAMSTVSVGVVVGNGLALIVGGGLAGLFGHNATMVLPVVGEMRPWQLVFLVLGLPGLVLAPILLFFVEDPPRRRIAVDAAGRPGKSNYFEMLKFVVAHRTTYAFNVLGYISCALANAGISAWMPAHMLRVFHVSISKAGITLGLCQMIASVIAVTYGGFWIDRKLESGQADGVMQLSRNAIVLAILPLLAFAQMPSFLLSVVMVVTAQTLTSLAYSVSSISHNPLSPNQIRAQFSVTFLFLSSITGGIVGPSAVAVLNKALFDDPQKIGTSASIVGAVALALAATLLTLGLKHYRRSMEIVMASTADSVSR